MGLKGNYTLKYIFAFLDTLLKTMILHITLNIKGIFSEHEKIYNKM